MVDPVDGELRTTHAGATMDRLVAYDWPGNIRELRNALERAIILSPRSRLLLEGLGDTPRKVSVASAGSAEVRTREYMEREHIIHVADACERRVQGLGIRPNRPLERSGFAGRSTPFRWAAIEPTPQYGAHNR